MVSLARRTAEGDQSGTRASGHGEILERLGRELSLSGPVAGGSGAVTFEVEGPNLRADGRTGGGSDHLFTGRNRRGSQLGLPVLLVARCPLHSRYFKGNWSPR